MIHISTSLCQITENFSNMNFLLNGFKYTICYSEGAFSVDIPFLKPYGCDRYVVCMQMLA